MSERVTAMARLRAKAGREAEMWEQAATMVGPSLAEPGCLSYRNYADPEDPRVLVVVEEWESREAFDAHLASPHLARSLDRTAELLDGPPELRVLTDVRELADAQEPRP
ncbi:MULTISPECIES: putative quinol monooxygenase [Streptomyces]|uniref:putative quinol monooxygenase n=1 Tax=Streptomyces TaxID=1883 RepID=UPI0004AAB1B4|nr:MULTISPECIES: putative quinol monooxygenase [Streptomyces]